jgi:hypothetical protein
VHWAAANTVIYSFKKIQLNYNFKTIYFAGITQLSRECDRQGHLRHVNASVRVNGEGEFVDIDTVARVGSLSSAQQLGTERVASAHQPGVFKIESADRKTRVDSCPIFVIGIKNFVSSVRTC